MHVHRRYPPVAAAADAASVHNQQMRRPHRIHCDHTQVHTAAARMQVRTYHHHLPKEYGASVHRLLQRIAAAAAAAAAVAAAGKHDARHTETAMTEAHLDVAQRTSLADHVWRAHVLSGLLAVVAAVAAADRLHA